jgi:dTDP-4-dehydrorhamnose reductase
VAAAVSAAAPDVIVNCAAYNDVDGAEEDPSRAFRVNAFAVQALARAAASASAVFVHFSTDFVFDGQASEPYREDDRPGPLSVYGASKLVGEWLAGETPAHYVLRVESLFGGPTAGTTARAGSLGKIIEATQEGRSVPVFVDRTVSPTYAVDAATTTRQIVERRLPFGVYHAVNSGAARWDQVAEEAGRLLGRSPQLTPLTLESVNLKARRPQYCAMSNERLQAAGIPMRHWRDALAEYLQPRRRT